jgi:cytochrome c oxidase subunit 2
VGRFWSLFFLLVPILGVATFVAAPWYHHWLPEDVSISGEGDVVDSLFYFILYLTGAVFIATEVVLVWFMWKYDAAKNAEPVKYSHGNHTLEIVWTIIPAGTLLFIAIYQMNAWANQTMRVPANPGLTVEVTARQFEWRIKYPGPDGQLGTLDDIHTVNDLHIPAHQTVLMHLKSQDVLHSFFLPNLRVKQDAVPGMTIPVWYTAVKPGNYDLVCAELCGWGHYKMKGRLTVQNPDDFSRWLEELRVNQESEK